MRYYLKTRKAWGGHYGLRQRACMDIGGFDDISLSDESTERA